MQELSIDSPSGGRSFSDLSRLYPTRTQPVQVGPWTLGAEGFCVVAGPCSIESKNQFTETAQHVRECGAALLRGGVFKMRTCANSFQGLGDEALDIANEVSRTMGLPVVCEITDPRQLDSFVEAVDMLQVGSRNMYNYSLLKELGRIKKPILLKRGFSATVDEWLQAADYIVKGGNSQVVLCERGIRTFETKMRNTLDLAVVPYLKQNSPFPVIVDPSHATGKPSLIGPMALAAAAAGADGIMIEVHPHPEEALSDGFQALTFAHFASLMVELKSLLRALGRPLLCAPSAAALATNFDRSPQAAGSATSGSANPGSTHSVSAMQNVAPTVATNLGASTTAMVDATSTTAELS